MSKKIVVFEALGEYAIVDENTNEYFQPTTIEETLTIIRMLLKDKKELTDVEGSFIVTKQRPMGGGLR